MTWRRETDVRKWVRTQKGVKSRWVEPSQGSTLGTPDLWFNLVARGAPWPITVWIELKLGEMQGNFLKFTVRPEQRKSIRQLVSEGAPVFIVVGIKKTRTLWLLKPTKNAIEGNVNLPKEAAVQNAIELGWAEYGLKNGVIQAIFGDDGSYSLVGL